VVIGVLASITIVSFNGISRQATVVSIKSDLSNSIKRIQLYYIDNGHYPVSYNTNNCPEGPIDPRYCLMPSKGNELSYSSQGPSYLTYSLDNKNTNSGIVYRITNNSLASEVAPLASIGSISGNAGTGDTITAGVLSPAGATATYQWQRADTVSGSYTNIAGATNNTYVPIIADAAKFIRVVATGSNTYGSSVTSSATSAVLYYAPNGNYYISSDGTLKAGVSVALSGATYGSIFAQYWSDSTGTWGGAPSYAKLTNNKGIHIYSTNARIVFDISYVLQNNMQFRPSSTINIYLPQLFITDSGYDGEDGNYENWAVPIGVSGSYITVQ